MFSRLVELILLALLVVSIDANQRQARQVSTVTRKSTKTTTSFTTITLTTRTICGNYINATTACRRKRQFWIDRPIVLALDEELDPFVEQILNPSLVLSIQPTARPFFRHEDPAFSDSEVRSSRIERPSLPDIHGLNLFRDGLSPFRSLRPYRPAYNYNQYTKSPSSIVPEGRIGAVGLLNLFAQILGIAPTTTTTITTIVSSTATSFTTTTATFIISVCSPPGLTYAPCA